MSTYTHNPDSLEHHPQDAASSPTRAYFPASKTTSISPAITTALSEKLAATLVSKKAYINMPSIQRVMASHSTKSADHTDAPDYDDTIANIPDLDLLPPPPVYDIVNCSTSQTLLLVSSLINTILAVNDRLACPKITLFHSRAIPNISVDAYLSRILQYAPFQNEVLLIILLYFDRIGGGCKPTQVLTNTIPRSLLRQASMTPEDIKQLTAPKVEGSDEDNMRSNEKAELAARFSRETAAAEAAEMAETTEPDMSAMDEEEPVADEIYTSSSESPVGSKLIINSFNIHRLLITSILVASKFSSDVFYPNVRYSRVGGLPLSELNQLELEFLFLSQFDLNTTESELQTYGNKLLMYHQRLNGTERASTDAIIPAKGEYVRLSDKKHIVHDSKPALPQVQTSLQPSQHQSSTESDSQAFVSSGPYRDNKETIDDDEVMSEKAEDQPESPIEWQSDQIALATEVEAPSAKFPPRQRQRSNKMNLDHMIWPTNEMDTKYTPSAYYGAMEKDEDAARIEEEFKKASPPPESGEPNPKRKLQRLSSGTLEAVPAKRVNTPGRTSSSEKSASLVSPNGSGNSKNIFQPLLRKIASFASHRTEATPAPDPEPQPPALRSHPYLVRHQVSPASSSTNMADSEEMASPTTPVFRSMPWQQADYSSQSQGHGHMRSSSSQMKPPPPPYSGQDQAHGEHDRHYSRSMNQTAGFRSSSGSATSRHGQRRQHRSREPSLSSLASELTFEPTRSSLSPMVEETRPNSSQETNSTHPATLAPFYFPPKPQSIQAPRHQQHQQYLSHPDHSTPPVASMAREDRSGSDIQDHTEPQDCEFASPSSASAHQSSNASPTSQTDDSAMQCDDEEPAELPIPGRQNATAPSPRHFYSEPVAVPVSRSTSLAQNKYKMRASERIETGSSLLDAGAPLSSPISTTSSVSASSSSRRGTESEALSAAGRPWIPRDFAPAPTRSPIQYPHPQYVTSYYPAPNVQLVQGSASPEALAVAIRPQSGMVAISRKPQAFLPSTPLLTSANGINRQQPIAPATGPRPTRQFAPIRPRTPMTTADEDSRGRVAQLTNEPSLSSSSSSSSSPALKKKKGSSSENRAQQPPQPLRTLVPTVLAAGGAAAPPPYRPPFIAYPSPYAHHLPHHQIPGQPALRGLNGNPIGPTSVPAPMIMAVDYTHGAALAAAAAGHGPQFIAATGPSGPGNHGGGTTRLYIPVIPVMYNKPPPQLAPATAAPSASSANGKAAGKTNTPARIAPRLNRPV
ncbi:hypothetical protein BGZ98_001765 [Dissophora globulifera]|nr:hypothetical protein BGZ98_001765 [Dissophora globulifera]